MGRWSYSTKEEADYLKKIEIWWLKKHGYLDGWKSGGIAWTDGFSGNKSSVGITVSTLDGDNYLQFSYTQTNLDGEKKSFNYKVSLTTTPCNYGGKRYWFICPLIKNGQYCGRRIGVLYKGSDYFGCRKCQNLTYSSQNENRRYKIYPLFRILDIEMKSEKLEKALKRSFYAGKPTKRYRRLMGLRRKILPYMALARSNKLV